MLRKEACSGSIHDLAHISIQNCLADCWPKSSAKADNLITTVKNGVYLEVDAHPNFRTLMEHKAFLSAWSRTFMHKRDKNVFFLNDFKILLHQLHEKDHSMLCLLKLPWILRVKMLRI